MNLEDVTYVDRPQQLEAVARALSRAHLVAVDTESNSLHVYREQVCFVQIAVGFEPGANRHPGSPLGAIFIIDGVALRDLSILREPFADRRRTKILHGADYDVVCLRRDFGIEINGLFDTMIASQVMGYEQVGLAATLKRHLDLDVEKAHARHDWGRRPLEDAFLPYLVEDVVHLHRVYQQLWEELEAADRLEEAHIEFERVSRLEWNGNVGVDPEGFRKIKGARELDHTGLSILRELYLLRERIADKHNRPPFRVLGNRQLLDVAARRPKSARELSKITGFSQRVMSQLGDDVLRCVVRGIRGRAELPYRVRTKERPAWPQTAREDALRDWRKRRVQRDSLPPVVVLPNHVLERLARLRPETLESLSEIDGLGQRRLEKYGAELLELLAQPQESEPPPRRRTHQS